MTMLPTSSALRLKVYASFSAKKTAERREFRLRQLRWGFVKFGALSFAVTRDDSVGWTRLGDHGVDLLAKSGDGLGLVGTVGEVRRFAGVDFVDLQFMVVFAFVPQRVTVTVRSDRISHLCLFHFVFPDDSRHLRRCEASAFCLGVAKHRIQVLSVGRNGELKTCH